MYIEKIRNQQQGKDGTAAYCVGEQLIEMVKDKPALQELIDQDLDQETMSLETAADKIKAYADKHHGKEKCFCVTPQQAEKILAEFYGLPEADGELASDTATQATPAGFIDLASFL